jgi:hypothetical protein
MTENVTLNTISLKILRYAHMLIAKMQIVGSACMVPIQVFSPGFGSFFEYKLIEILLALLGNHNLVAIEF